MILYLSLIHAASTRVGHGIPVYLVPWNT